MGIMEGALSERGHCLEMELTLALILCIYQRSPPLGHSVSALASFRGVTAARLGGRRLDDWQRRCFRQSVQISLNEQKRVDRGGDNQAFIKCPNGLYAHLQRRARWVRVCRGPVFAPKCVAGSSVTDQRPKPSPEVAARLLRLHKTTKSTVPLASRWAPVSKQRCASNLPRFRLVIVHNNNYNFKKSKHCSSI